MSLSQKFKSARLEQDLAAGGSERRKIYVRSGDLVTISLELTIRTGKIAVSLRYKSGGCYRQTVGLVPRVDRSEALKLGWKMLRDSDLISRNQWKWFVE